MPRGIRLNPEHDDRTRAKIQTSQIVNRLQQLIKGEIEMTAQQVRAAEILLKKTLPDLSSVDHDGTLAIKDPMASLRESIQNRSAGLPAQDRAEDPR